MAAVFDRIAIIGVGLIGGSIARAARETGAAGDVVLFDRDTAALKRAGEIGFGRAAATIEDAVRDADAVFHCVPVGAMAAVAAEIAPELSPDTVVSDVGSVKESVAKVLGAALPGVHVIPAHPVAGTEKSGPDAGFASLFKGRWCIITPPPRADATMVERLSQFWQRLGSKVDLMDATHHDRVLAVTSHLPHLIAYSIVGTASDLEEVTKSEVIKYSAGGFRDFTRIAASDPVMWRDVFLTNRGAVLEMLGRFTEDLTALQRAIRWGDGDTLMREFTRARTIRKAIIDAGQDSASVNFGRNTTKAEE
ncbi:MAG TPA: prephenate/arogenate dehydrogenase family protein [Alphaproteobacteria bacterium]|nr:prephenate/arogenate dehydrogenase family protein [Alphaproteobacteria bacterium]